MLHIFELLPLTTEPDPAPSKVATKLPAATPAIITMAKGKGVLPDHGRFVVSVIWFCNPSLCSPVSHLLMCLVLFDQSGVMEQG
jgi:hypothetical protein